MISFGSAPFRLMLTLLWRLDGFMAAERFSRLKLLTLAVAWSLYSGTACTWGGASCSEFSAPGSGTERSADTNDSIPGGASTAYFGSGVPAA